MNVVPTPTRLSTAMAPLALRPLSDAQQYDAFSRKNIELGPIMGFAGAGGGAFVGSMLASASAG